LTDDAINVVTDGCKELWKREFNLQELVSEGIMVASPDSPCDLKKLRCQAGFLQD
jgi:hypothetical protein